MIFILVCAVVLGGLLLMLRSVTWYLQDNSPTVVGVVYSSMNNPYFVEINDILTDIVEGHGDILLTRYSDLSQERENREIQELVDNGVQAILIVPCEYSRITPALEACEEAEVPVFLLDTGADNMDKVVSIIQSDQREIGRLIAEDMKERFPESARILILYDYKYRSMIDRMYGFTDEIYGDDRYEVVAAQDNTFEFATASNEVASLLREHQDLDVIVGFNDPATMGAVAALEEYRLYEGDYQEVAIYSVDASPDGKTLLERGKITGNVSQHPTQVARAAAKAVYDWLEGDPVDKEILIPVDLVTRENLDYSNVRGWEQ